MSTPAVLLTPEELSDLEEINRLLYEANRHSLERDGLGKSSEGAISLHFGNHWDRLDEADRKSPSVSIYAYLLGPHRNHDFDSIQEALETVRVWHRDEMVREDDDWEDPDWTEAPAVIASTCRCPEGVWLQVTGGRWKCARCDEKRHWSELRDVTPLYTMEQVQTMIRHNYAVQEFWRVRP